MESQSQKKKRKGRHPLDEEVGSTKRFKENENSAFVSSQDETAGRVKKIILRNFLCHDHLVMDFNKNVNFIVGRNGSGKSAILSAITVGLGGRAATTQRGDSFKSFIKNGKTSFTIEVTLTNEGAKAYEPEVYGNIIKVIRTVTQTSSTVITKNQRDHIVSRKKSDLDKITAAFNIQVDNPISILTQKNAKEFLIQPKPSKLYELFMKATQLETIGANYKEALQISKETQTQMRDTQRELHRDKKEIDEIEGKIKAIDNLESERKKCHELECEARWARVIAQEARLSAAERAVKKGEKTVESLVVSSDQNYSGKTEEIDASIAEISERIKESEKEAAECEAANDAIRNKSQAKKDELTAKQRELRDNKRAINKTQGELEEVNREIVRLDSVSSQAHDEIAQLEQRLITIEEELREVQQRISTAQVDQMHNDSDKVRLQKEEKECAEDVRCKEAKLKQLTNELQTFSSASNNSLGRYGSNIERLVKRINEEDMHRRFKHKPRGPVGAYIKMKDKTWSPIVERHIGSAISAFCVDNNKDAQLLGKIIQEIYGRQRGPEIICSKFLDRTHDVRENSTRTEKYPNMFEVMEVADPVIANCLIDQRGPESILLIPTTEEAIALLQYSENVPQNCRMAFTRSGDTFYPDPDFRTYGGSVPTPRYLEESVTQLIQSLKMQIREIEPELVESRKQLNIVRQAVSRSAVMTNDLMKKIAQLRGMKNRLSDTADELRDKLKDKEDASADNRPHFLTLRSDKEKELEQLRNVEQRISDEVRKLQQQFNEIDAEFKRCREKANGVDELINPLKTQIRKLEEEKRQCQIQMKEADKRILTARHDLQKAVAEADIQKRTLQVYLDEAEQHSRRIETKLSEEVINEKVKAVKLRIASVEKKYGSRDELYEQLESKKTKYLEVQEVLTALVETNEQHLQRVENRRKEYKDMRTEMGSKVEDAFSKALTVRGYRGSLTINYANKTLELDVIPQNTTGRDQNDTMTLSGGERSYATVSFVLALWECTALPFYFLDEFDVFMDKVNRRIIMAFLLEHTRNHPQSQFGFFTPLDASIVKASDYLTIHQLEAPERRQTQEGQ
ncbi:structural maintenance of chromosomes protein 6 [Diachasma alloeum]|uniref:structural maintenance of chromosomes protein 6 n=1 Tax=Diachasma alloeum TaxID=454923 RepID=UPI0007383E30|nr:structural maintenance of chromosomes protein 6 [Diachasma alloeum]